MTRTVPTVRLNTQVCTHIHTHNKIHHKHLNLKAVLLQGIMCSVPHVTFFFVVQELISLLYCSVNHEISRILGLYLKRDVGASSLVKPVTSWFLTPARCLRRNRRRRQRDRSLALTFPLGHVSTQTRGSLGNCPQLAQ